MSSTCRHLLGSGKAVVAATALTVATTITPPAPVSAAVEKPRSIAVSLATASTALPAPEDVPRLLVQWIQRVVVPPSFGADLPSPQFPPVVAPTSIGSSIKNVYNSVEPWVQYGFDLAAYAVGWVPYVGWLAPQIPIFYHFGERIARSVTFNIADWIDGRVSFSQGLINVIVDTFNSFVQLGIDQWNFWLPSLPPLPPLPLAASVPSAPTVVEEVAAPIEELAAPIVTRSRELRTADETSAPPEPTSSPAEEPGTPDSPTVAAAKDVAVSEQIAGQPVSSQDTTRSERPKPARLDAVESDAAEPAGPQAKADPSEKDTDSPSADEGAGDDDHEDGDADAGE